MDEHDDDDPVSAFAWDCLRAVGNVARPGSTRRVVLEALQSACAKAFPCDYEAIDELVEVIEQGVPE